MLAALALARRGLGQVWPNPAVGCVLVREDMGGRVVGRGWTQPGGRPHAETEALDRAGALARDATAYVTLEPCDHTGETPPCSKALVAAGIRRAIVAVEDPDPRTAGAGIARLKAAGIAVTEGVAAEAARQLNLGFFMRITKGRPMFTLKTATTLDGRVATAKGESKWITGESARAFAHGLRAEHDAIMVGIGTALADNPELTCRLPGLTHRSPVRVVLDSGLRLPPTSPLVETAGRVPVWIYDAPGAAAARRQALAKPGVTIIEAETDSHGRPDLGWVALDLGRRGLTRVLVESGGALAAALLKRDLIDRIAWFRAPKLIGGDGLGAVAPFGIGGLDEAPAFVLDSIASAGADVLETYRRRT
ncbi:MAG TPA: bifunctional diaminohydroxyphosphoribosylaminopyrimidine deaminase/5-amino-6-(5-phosphoribosylamino)uracil reductase RibD [Rhodospirillales bacterium]